MVKLEEDFQSRSIKLIEAGNFQEFNHEAKEKEIDEILALRCVTALSRYCFYTKKEDVQINSPSDVIDLTKRFAIIIKPNKGNTLRYLTSLYHIIHFLHDKVNKVHSDNIASLLNIVVEFKNNYPDLYENEGKTLHSYFISCFMTVVKKLASEDISANNVASILSLFGTMRQLLVVNNTNTISKGTVLLQNILQASQILSKTDENVAVGVITTGLKEMYSVDTVEDLDTCLQVLFKVYTCLYCYQSSIAGHHSAMLAVSAHLDQVKWKWSQEIHANCFMMLRNATTIFMWNFLEPSFTSKVQENIAVLINFQRLSKDACVNAACTLMETMLKNFHKAPGNYSSAMPKSCLKPFLQMLLLLYGVFNDSEKEKMDHIKCLLDIYLFINRIDKTQNYSEQLKQCMEIVVQAKCDIIKAVNNMILTEHQKTKQSIVMSLHCFANLLQVYRQANLYEEVIILGKPICKFLCSLSPEVLKNPELKATREALFIVLVSCQGTKRLDDCLEALLAWRLSCPHDSKKAFTLWGNLKHNCVCDGNTKHLNTTVHTVVECKKFVFEHDWFECQLSDNEIGNLLVEELKTYFKNTTLRGEPVIAATDTLLALNTNSITKVEGLVIALDVVSAFEKFAEQSAQYYSESKSLIRLLRKEKKQDDPVQFHLCMGNLIYVQLLCEIRNLRKECESEMVRLTVEPAKPLVSELPESRPDPNDTCDVAAKYHNLCLTEHRKILESVDNAIRHWGFAYAMLKEQENKEYDLTVTLSILKSAGLLLHLYCDNVKQEKIWKLLYDLATLAGDVNMIVTSVSGMLNESQPVSQDLIDNAMKLLQLPEVDFKRVAYPFQLNLAMSYLSLDKEADGMKILQDIESPDMREGFMYIHFWYDTGLCHLLSNGKALNLKLQTPSYHLSFHKVVTHLLYLAEEKKWLNLAEASWIHSMMLRATQLLGERNLALVQPREVRFYLKAFLGLAQKLALPLRTVQLLLLLAWVDLMTGNVDDCAVKLEGLEDLLEICGAPIVYQEVPGSPQHSRGQTVLSLPEYLNHPVACSCLACTTEEYRRLVLETITLRGAFCANFGQLKDGLQCFEVAIRVEEDLMSRSHNREILRSRIRMWTHYADVLALSEKYQDASNANQSALVLLSTVKDPTIVQHVMEQKAVLQQCQQSLQLQPRGSRISIKMKRSKIPQLQQTPKNTLKSLEKSPLTVVNENAMPVTPCARPVRPFKLPSSGEENTPPVIVTKSKRKVKPLPNFISQTPQSIHIASATKSSKPFVIVDDDGNAVAVSGKKTSKTLKKIPTKLANKSIVEAPKKKLFNSNTGCSNLKTELAVPISDHEDTLVRKSNRAASLKTYGKLKKPSKSKLLCPQQEYSSDSKPFDFNEMKSAIDNLNNVDANDFVEEITASKVTSTKLPKPASHKTFSDQVQSSRSEMSQTRNPQTVPKQSEVEYDSDVVEGTPPQVFKEPPRIINLRRTTRTTRSKK